MRSSLELLLLSLVRDGFATPYELKAHADISLGSTVPALARLAEDGLIRASEPQSRRSRRYSVTSKGAKILDSEWREQLKSGVSDVESALRIAYLALLNRDTEHCAQFLERSSNRLCGLATMAEAEATRFAQHSEGTNNETLRWLRARVAVRRLESEANELRALAAEIRKRTSDGAEIRKKNKIAKRRKSQIPN